MLLERNRPRAGPPTIAVGKELCTSVHARVQVRPLDAMLSRRAKPVFGEDRLGAMRPGTLLCTPNTADLMANQSLRGQPQTGDAG